ncbi:MAG: flagellar assembly protein FliH/Type III secretion system HrpE [Acidobacteriia bacterium]|nr:flagellar assembly protein FliH/Type III secretion system HrpE [Terriglobia bacterium]
MSTLSDNAGSSAVKDVATFVYRDNPVSLSRPDGLKIPGEERPEDNPPKPDNGSHVSEQELTRLVGEAHAEGLREGDRRTREYFEQELTRLHKQTADLVSAFQKERSKYFSKVEVKLVQFALAIAAKILHREAQVDRMVVAGLVKIMLEQMQQGTSVIVRVRPEDRARWTHYFEANSNLQVLEDATLAAGGCLLETELGTADMGLDAQLQEIEKGFFDLLAQRPESK